MVRTDKLLKLAEYFFRLADSASYQLEQEYLESNPEKLNNYLDALKDRQRRWRERQDQEILKQKDREKAKRYTEQKKTIRESGSLEGLLLKLGQQIADRKRDIGRKNNPQALALITQIAQDVNNFRFNIREYLYGMNEKPGQPYGAQPEKLFQLIEEAKKQHKLLSKFSAAMGNTTAQIITKLQELADTYSIH